MKQHTFTFAYFVKYQLIIYNDTINFKTYYTYVFLKAEVDIQPSKSKYETFFIININYPSLLEVQWFICLVPIPCTNSASI